MSGTACASVKLVGPPSALLNDCPITYVNPETNGELAIEDKLRERDLINCNADKAALREWNKQIKR